MTDIALVPNKVWINFDKFMRLGGHKKLGAAVYRKGSKLYRLNADGCMNQNMASRYEIFLHKWFEGGKEYLDTLSVK